MRRLVPLVAALAAVASFATLGQARTPAVRTPAADVAKRPPPLTFHHRCVTPAERKRVVRFLAADGVRLIGVTFGAGPRGLVLAHQGPNGSLCTWVPYARILAGLGYRVLALDLRGRGSSGSAKTLAALQRVDLDVIGAVREFRRRGVRSVVLAGGSLGGVAVLGAAARLEPPVQGVISLSAPQSWVRIDGLAAARQLRVPALFVAAEEDGDFDLDAQALYDAAAAPDKQVAIFPGGAHGERLLREAPVRSVVDAWIAARLPA